MSSVYIVERLNLNGKADNPPEFMYNLSTNWQHCTDLAKVIAYDGAERYEEQAIMDCQDITKEMRHPCRVRRVKLSFELYVQSAKKISLDKPQEAITVSE